MCRNCTIIFDNSLQYCLSERPNRPCYIIKFKQATLMLDCGLDLLPVLQFMPIPLVHSPRLATLPKYSSKEKPELEGEIRESTLQGRFFIDCEPEFRGKIETKLKLKK